MERSIEPCTQGWCDQPAGHVEDHQRWLGQWHGRARGNGREVTVQALLTGTLVPHVELVMVDSGDIVGQSVAVLSWPDVDELAGTLVDARRRWAQQP